MEWKRKTTKNQNPYLYDGSVGGHGNKSEKRILKSMGAEQQIGSGAFEGLKSDGIQSVGDQQFRIECKATNKKSMSLKHEWLRKIREEALEHGMTPILTVSFVELDGTAKEAGDWVMIPKYLWNEVCSD